MTMNERRAEIMRILVARRATTMPVLARTFGVTTRTIQNDILAFTVDYPLETKQGNGGCVRVADWYHPHRNLLSEEQQRTLSHRLERIQKRLKKCSNRPTRFALPVAYKWRDVERSRKRRP